MTYVPYRGGTLLVPSGPSGMHLFVTMTDICENGFHLLLSVTSIKEKKAHDPACVFSGGEHPFITKPCYVYYRMAEQKLAQTISNAVERGLFVPREDMPPDPFQAICDGIEESDFIGQWAVDYFRKNTKPPA